MKLSILDRYIGREIIQSFLLAMFVLLIIVMSIQAVYFLKHVAEGRIAAEGLMGLMGNIFVGYVIKLTPICLFFGVLLAFGRLYKDSEMAAIMSSGIGPMQWNRPLLIVVLPVSAFLLFLMLYISPIVAEHRNVLKSELYNRAEGSQYTAGQFNRSRDGKAVFFMESNDDESGLMKSVFYSSQGNGENTVDISESAKSQFDENNRLFMVMYQGHQYIGASGEANYRIIEYDEYGISIPDNNSATKKIPHATRSSYELMKSSNPAMLSELQWRITVPLAAVLSALIALPLSRTSPRSGRFAKLAVAILVYLVYSNLLGVGTKWISQSTVPFWVGTWWVHLLALIFLVALWVQGGFINLKDKGSTSLKTLP